MELLNAHYSNLRTDTGSKNEKRKDVYRNLVDFFLNESLDFQSIDVKNFVKNNISTIYDKGRKIIGKILNSLNTSKLLKKNEYIIINIAKIKNNIKNTKNRKIL